MFCESIYCILEHGGCDDRRWSCFSNPSSVEAIPMSGQVSGNAKESSAKRETDKEEQPKSKACSKPSSNTDTPGAENSKRVFTISRKDLKNQKH